jgi:hypothetical protein
MARMATIFRALMTAVLLLSGYVTWNGWQLSQALLAGTTGEASVEALRATHLRTGFVVSIVAALAQSVPFAYFLGTGFWVKAFARASRADDSWEQRQKRWLKSRAFVVMALAPLATVAAAVTGALTDGGSLAPLGHIGPGLLALVATLASLVVVPPEMQRNSALMDELAQRHQVPRPGSREADELIAFEETRALPPLFQLSRVMMFFGAQAIVIWLYLRFGTDGWRDTPLLPFGLGCLVLVTGGLALNGIHDPDKPRPAAQSWARALAVGIVGSALLALAVSATD